MPFRIERNDITKLSVDCIVNTADPEPIVGFGCDTAIHDAAGPGLIEARIEIGEIEPGNAVPTPAFDLDADYVMHTVSPVWTGGMSGERRLLRKAYDSALYQARDLGCESIAFPLMAAGTLGFPKQIALRIAVDAFSDFLMENDMDIILCVFDSDTFRLSSRLTRDIDSFIDDHYIDAAIEREYTSREIMEINDSLADDPDWLLLEKIRRGQCTDRKVTEHLRTVLESYPLVLEIMDGPREEAMLSECTEPLDLPLEEEKPGLSSDMSCSDVNRLVENVARELSEDQERRKFQDDLRDGIRYQTLSPDMMVSKAAPMIPPGMGSLRKAPAHPHADDSRTDLNSILKDMDAGFSDTLRHLINESGEKPSDIYKRANIDRKLYSKIMNQTDYQPSKPTAIAFALALRLDLEGTEDLIRRAGYALTRSSTFDVIIEWCILKRLWNIVEINMILFDYDQPLLGTK